MERVVVVKLPGMQTAVQHAVSIEMVVLNSEPGIQDFGRQRLRRSISDARVVILRHVLLVFGVTSVT